MILRYSTTPRGHPPSMPGQTPSVRSLGGEGLKGMLPWCSHVVVSPPSGAKPDGGAIAWQSVPNEQQRAGAGRSAPAQGSSSNGRGQNIICLPFARALPAFSNSPAASLGQGADVMVEGETLLVLLSLARRRTSAATAPRASLDVEAALQQQQQAADPQQQSRRFQA